jgi:hypothetical protein
LIATAASSSQPDPSGIRVRGRRRGTSVYGPPVHGKRDDPRRVLESSAMTRRSHVPRRGSMLTPRGCGSGRDVHRCDGRHEIDGAPPGDTGPAPTVAGTQGNSRESQQHVAEIVLRERAPLELDFRLARIHGRTIRRLIAAQFTVLDDADGLDARAADSGVRAESTTRRWLGGGESTKRNRFMRPRSRRQCGSHPGAAPGPLHPDLKRPREVRELPAPSDGVLRATFRLKRE